MKTLCAAVCVSALAFYMGQAAAATFPKPEDFKPVGAPAETAAESGPERHEPAAPPNHSFGDTAQGSRGSSVEVGHGDGHGDAHHGHAYHRHHVALFGGITLHEEEAHPTAGLDYELRLNQKLGVLAMAEVMFAGDPVQIYGLGAGWHVTDPLRFALIPALEVAHGHMEFLARVNVEYGFHVGSLSVGPSASLDYVAGHILPCVGVVVGSGF